MDVGFNQAEPHMSNAAMHNTELRPGAWRDPAEQNNDAPSPFSTGGDDEMQQAEGTAQSGNDTSHSTETAANGAEAQSTTISNGISHNANSHVQVEIKSDAPSANEVSSQDASTITAEPTQSSNALQSHEMKSEQSQSKPASGAVNIQALLDQLSGSVAPSASATPANNGPPATIAQLPLRSQADASSSLAAVAASPSGLPPRPPPQDQPLINSAYAHSQHIRDYHPHASTPAVHAQSHSNSAGNVASPQSHNIVPPVGAHPQQALQGQGGYQSQHTPVSANFPVSTPVPQSQQFSPGRAISAMGGESPLAGTEDRPWTADTQRKYDYFMNEERRYVNEARWDQFPSGSRLFVGKSDQCL